jgi:hypothetical protein
VSKHDTLCQSCKDDVFFNVVCVQVENEKFNQENKMELPNIVDYESDMYAENFVRVEILGQSMPSQEVLMKYTVINSENKRTAVSYGHAGRVAHA